MKFGLKISNRFGKNVRKSKWGFFVIHTVDVARETGVGGHVNEDVRKKVLNLLGRVL